MKKKILIGSMLVLTLLLLMPSIPAIQQKTIEDKAYSDFTEMFGDVDAEFIELFEDVNFEDIGILDGDVKFSILQYIVYYIFVIRFFHGLTLSLYGTEILLNYAGPGQLIVASLALMIMTRGGWLFSTAVLWIEYWMNLSDTYGWNWHLPNPPPESI